VTGLRLSLLSLALAAALAACHAPGPQAALVLGAWQPAGTRVVVAVAPARQLLATARAWRPSDVYSHVVTLAPVAPPAPGDADPAASGALGEEAASGALADPSASGGTPPATRTVELVQRPGAVREAIFDDVPPGWRYEVTVQAMGNVGGTAPARCLNAREPSRGWLDLTRPGEASRRLDLAVRLDPEVFSGTLHLPTTAGDAVPAWTTQLEATLHPAGAADVVASAAWRPGQRARFERLRGDAPYDLAVTYHSPTGHRTTRVPGLRFVLSEDPETALTPAVTPPAPPPGTRLAYQGFGTSGGFMAAVDPAGRIWITHQNAGRVSVRTAGLAFDLPEIGVGVEPRGIAIDPTSGMAWVANFRGNSVSRITTNGVVTGTFSAGWFPSGIGVDAQHRVWVASALLGTVRVLGADGVQVAGSPFYSGSQPGALAIDRDTGAVWVANMGEDTLTRFLPSGEVAGVYGAGFTPGAIAIAPDHSVWVVDGGGNRIWRFSPEGAVVGEPFPVGPGPSGLAINPVTGEAWVGVMHGEQVSRLAADGTVLGTYAVGHFPGTVALEADGTAVVVGGSAASRLAP